MRDSEAGAGGYKKDTQRERDKIWKALMAVQSEHEMEQDTHLNPEDRPGSTRSFSEMS